MALATDAEKARDIHALRNRVQLAVEMLDISFDVMTDMPRLTFLWIMHHPDGTHDVTFGLVQHDNGDVTFDAAIRLPDTGYLVPDKPHLMVTNPTAGICAVAVEEWTLAVSRGEF